MSPTLTSANLSEARARQAATNALCESEQRFGALVSASSDVVYRMSPDWTEMRQLHGREFIHDTEGPSRTWLQKYIHPDDQPLVMAAIEDAVRTKCVFELEHRVLRVDGTLGWTHSRAIPMLNEAGEILEWFGAASDITQRKCAEEALYRSRGEMERQRRLFEAILTNTPDLAYVFDLNHRFTYANEVLLKMWGRTLEEAIGKNCLELGYEPWHAAMHDREIDQVVVTKQTIRGEVPFEGTFGRRIYEYIFVPVLGADGNVEAVAGTTRDVTERKRTEEALAESEALKSAILEAGLDCIITIDRDGDIVEWNSAAERIFGLTRNAALNCQMAELIIPPEHRGAHCRGLARYLATGEGPILGRRIEVEALRADGSRFPAELVVAPTSAGGRTLFTAYLRDVAEQKRAAAALRESEVRLRDLLATLDLGAFMARDLDGTIRFWSQGCKQLYGWSAEEAVGCSAHELLGTVFPIPLPEIEAVLLRDDEWSGDLVQRRRDGTEITVAAHKALRRDADGQAVALVESVADVSALRAAKSELQRLNESLETRVSEEMAARETAQARLVQAEKMTALGQLAGGIAHDFNNILQAVSGGAALIGRRASDPATVQRLAQIVEDAARRGTSVTGRLLSFARRGELRAEPVNLTVLLEALREILAHTLGAGVTIHLEVAPALPPVLADRGQLETALINLATNARDAMPHGGRLVLSASTESVLDEHRESLVPGTYVRIAVADTGVGMDATTLARVMEPFFTTKEPGKGTGLGLPMARGFAEQSGGALAIASKQGLGTTATLWLPATNAVCLQTTGEPEEFEVPGAQARRILLVDDEELVREVLAAELADRGYEVVQAEGGGAALALLDAGERVDLLVSDLSMPLMDGIVLIQEAQRRRPRLPAILLTGYVGGASNAAVGEAVRGSFSLLRKPVGGAQLADRIATLLEAAAVRRL